MIRRSYFSKRVARRLGFSLAEVVVALTIGAMVMVSVLAIYNRAERSAEAITRKIEDGRLSAEVLQRIAEDLDGILSAGADTKITIDSGKFDNGYPIARMEIVRTYYDQDDKPQVFERVVWQSSYDYDSEYGGLVLYRSHSGIGTEDKLLDEKKEDWQRQLFVPICDGLSYFKIQVPKALEFGELEFEDVWTEASLPLGVVVGVSFAEPFKTVEGTLDVAEEEKVSRAIAIDRTRKIKFVAAERTEDDPNSKEAKTGDDDEGAGKDEGKDKSEDKTKLDESGNKVVGTSTGE